MIELLGRIGWSNRFFARQVGVDERTVSRWCSGKENSVARSYLELVARILGV